MNHQHVSQRLLRTGQQLRFDVRVDHALAFILHQFDLRSGLQNLPFHGFSQLQSRFRGRDLKREGRPILIRNVPYPDHIRDLQNQYGREYVQFYYVDEPLMKAIKLTGINLQFLQLAFGAPAGAAVYKTITLPAQYWE